MRGRGRRDVSDDVRAGLELPLQLVACRLRRAVPVEGVAVLPHLLLASPDALAGTRSLVLELRQGQQVLVCLLAPLAETDQHEILLQVTLLLRQRVQAGVLDRHRCLQRQALRALHLLWREGVLAVTLGQDRGSDGLAVRHQRKREQRAHAKRLHV